MSRVLPLAGLALGVTLAACADWQAPGEVTAPRVEAAAHDHHAAAGETKAFVGGWLEGQVEPAALRYTRSYFCEEPPTSGAADTECEVGADPLSFPRPGMLPKMYALAPAFQPGPDPSTIHCAAGTVCPNHPPHLDLSRLGGSSNAPAAAHSHIIEDRQGGWHQTMNVRVGSLAIWNEIASEPAGMRLAKLRALQADPALRSAGLISGDFPTNIYFFIEVHSLARP